MMNRLLSVALLLRRLARELLASRLCWLGVMGLTGWMCAQSSAQAATYAFRSETFAYDTPSASASEVIWHTTRDSVSCTQYPDGDDDWADVNFPSGFTFTFGGVSYSSVRVYANGILAFPPDTSGFHRTFTPQALPITAAGAAYTGCTNATPARLMMAYWVDIIAGSASNVTGASVKWERLTDSATGQQRLVFTWNNVALYGNLNTRYSFQIALFPSASGVNGNFRYQYTTGSTTGSDATVGVQVSTTDYTQFAFKQPFIDTSVGTAVLWYPANQLASKRAEYRFDEGAWAGVSGEVKDISGGLQHATRLGNASNVAGGQLCRGGLFTNNTSNAVIDAVATPFVPTNRGSIDFWYKSVNAWNVADTLLFDATASAAQPFFLMKRANGALRFVLTDSSGALRTAETTTAYSFGAGTWHHIAVSWSMRPGSNQTVMQIMVDGALAATSGSTPFRSTTTGSMASMATLNIGDNRTSLVTPSTGTPNGANGYIDETYIYELDISPAQAAADMALTRPGCTTLDHFHIIHNGEVVNCGGALASITIEAHDANHDNFSLAGTTLQLATSTGHGTWSNVSGGSINNVINTGAAGSGNATYTFANESSIRLGLSNTFTEALNLNLSSGDVTESSGEASKSCAPKDYSFGTVCDADLRFSEAGFQFSVPHHVAETTQTVSVRAVKKSDGSACRPLFPNGGQNVTFRCSYTNPATGTLPVRVGGSALNASGDAAAQCDATGRASLLQFDGNGQSAISLMYADVGSMTLSASTTSAGVTISGSTAFTAAPARIAFSGLPAAPLTAGVPFNTTVQVQNNAGAATPNFGKETAAASVVVGSSNPQPAQGNAAPISATYGGFSGGQASQNLTWREVGTLQLNASISNYLGSNLNASGSLAAVGRFKPAYFTTQLSGLCVPGVFTYSRQPFTVLATAYEQGGGITANYAGSTWAKAATLSNAGASAGLSSTAINATDFVAGVGTAANISYTLATLTTAPGTVLLRVVDSDAVTSAGATEGSVVVRSGRARLQNAYGSERLDLPMMLRAEYWSGSGWLQNTDDNCTGDSALHSSNVVAVTLAPAALTCVLDTGNPGRSGAGCSSAGPTSPTDKQFRKGAAMVVSPLPSTLAKGDFNLWLKAPGAPGSVSVTVAVPAWLEYPWLSATRTDPVGRAIFGVFKSPLIYRRENY